MAKLDIKTLSDDQLKKLINNRWESSSTIWDTLNSVYKQNTAIYENKADWVNNLPYTRKNWAVHANRVFVNMESVINSIIANPPGINILPARDGEEAQEFARKLESFFRKKFIDLNIKETMRMGYRNLYFGRLIVIKAFWNPLINDFDYRAIDPRKIRVGKYARKEQDSEFAIEEIEDNLCSVLERFPNKKAEVMKKYGINDEAEAYIKNPDVTYKEAWINDYVIFKLEDIILDVIKNPYWDWDGILITEEEEQMLENKGEDALQGDYRRQKLQEIKLQQDQRQMALQAQSQALQPSGETDPNSEEPGESPESQTPITPTAEQYKPYYFNYFDNPRKPYIYGTIFNNENTPIGRTDMITLSAELQRGIDKRKMDIDENCELVNGIIKVDSSVMGKSDAQRIRFETKGIIWGKGVKDGVTRETGTPLPDMVFKDMIDSRSEIDNIMAASSAFRGEREGQETKAGRLALIQQSFLRLNELIQLGDYIYKEIFDWGMQLAKTRYTEYHYAKWMGKEDAREVIELIQDDFETGTEVKIVAGKTLPVDDEFKFEQAQNDFKQGALGLTDYLEISQYDNAKEVAQNAVKYKINPVIATGIPEEDLSKLQPQKTEEKPPNVSINYSDLPPDAQGQLLQKIGIQADPNMLVAKEVAANDKNKSELALKADQQAHLQEMDHKKQALETTKVIAPPQPVISNQ